MITAKNYAAQVARSLSASGDKVFADLSKKYEQAVHFAIPDGGRIMEDDLKGLDGQSLRLPYPKITIEYFVESPVQSNMHTKCSKRCVYAEELDTGEVLMIYSAFYDAFQEWATNPFGYILKQKWELNLGALNFYPLTKQSELMEKYNKMSSAEKYAFDGDALSEIGAVLSLCEALTCSNVGTEILDKVDPIKNAKRIKNGKLPFFETKVLVLKASTPKPIGQVGIGSHASPRQHLRRGHIRRLPKGNIWVNSCVVGNASNGIIAKSYEVLS